MSSRDKAPRDKEGTKQRLLQAGLTAFSEAGYEGTSVSQISNLAGVNVSLINRYFGGKEGLLIAIVQQFVDQKQSGELPYPPQDTLRDEVWKYFEHRYSFDTENSAFFRLAMSQIAIDKSFRDRALKSVKFAGDENFLARLSRLDRAGKIPKDLDQHELFRSMSLISFAVGFLEVEILSVPSENTLAFLKSMAKRLTAPQV